MTGQQPAPGTRLQVNVLSNLTASVWLAGVTFLAIPVIYRVLGPSQYAIVGLYLLAVQWSAFLDFGLSPALGRFAAQQNREGGSLARLRYLLSWFELLTLALGALLVLAGTALFHLEPGFVKTWASAGETPLLLFSAIMATLALRLSANLYRAGLTGIELQAQVSWINSVVVSARMGIPILLALAGHLSLAAFFLVQVGVGALETLWFRSCLLRATGSQRESIPQPEILRHARLGLSIAGLGVLWILSVQVDKLVLSSTLPLAQFGSFALAVQLASAVTLMTAPLQTAVLPRMTALLADARPAAAAELYTVSCLLCAVLGVASMFAILVCGKSLLLLIAGSGQDLSGLELIVAIYAFNNGLVAIMALNYALQNAVGDLRLHWMGAVGLSLVQVPLMYWLALQGNILLLAGAYMATMLAYILLWLPLAHRRFLTGGHRAWLRRALVYPLLVTVPAGAACTALFAGGPGVLLDIGQGVLTFIALCGAGVLSNGTTRGYITNLVASRG